MIADSTMIRSDLKRMIQSGDIKFGGNSKLKIYGTLDCASGKRMKRENRVFFSTEQEALTACYRPCGHCSREQYLKWIEQGSG